jgi:hypothetical protein
MIVIIIVEVNEERRMRPKEEQKSDPFLNYPMEADGPFRFEMRVYTILNGVIQPVESESEPDEFGFV